MRIQNSYEFLLILNRERMNQNMDKERLEKQFDFCREIDKEKLPKMIGYLSDGQQKENDAEHAWHMAIMTLLPVSYTHLTLPTILLV